MTATMPTLDEQLRTVALLRLRKADLDKAKKAAEEKFRYDYQALFLRLREHTDALDEAETRLRLLAVAGYRESLNRHPCAGVSIRMVQQVSYDATEALVWARRTGLALKLDAKAFESVAKASAGQPDAPPATVTVEPHAAISEDLSTLLGVPEPEPPRAA